MDIRKVKKLVEILEESGLEEIEITEGDDSVRISRKSQSIMTSITPSLPSINIPEKTETSVQVGNDINQSNKTEEKGFIVTAPMVGTFYASPTPGAAAFVHVGDRVNEGDTLCIIEAMKMMNQIESDVSGIITSMRVQNGEPVEYGQILFVIDQNTSD